MTAFSGQAFFNLHFILGAGVIFLLYAEIHYKLPGLFSRLKTDEPEIIADAPHRVEPGKPIPVLLLVKDANRYPISLHEVKIKVRFCEREEQHCFDFSGEAIQSDFWHKIVEIPVALSTSQAVRLDVSLSFSRAGEKRIRTAKNDNYKGCTQAPLQIQVTENVLPRLPGWYFGDLHYHTNYTDDQVEFGAPMSATRQIAKSMGLSFFCATDHSYDLDDEQGNYLKNDPKLGKWRAFRREVQALNAQEQEFVIVPGEEISTGNRRNRNVHFLVLNNEAFLPGNGDGAEKWLKTKPTTTIQQMLDAMESGAVAFAAHPAVRPPFIQRLLFRRGECELQDLQHARLAGLQLWNGAPHGLSEGMHLWRKLLLEGKKLFIAGGNDAHGNFNRYRQISIPFLTMDEHHQHLFGKVRTAVFVEGDFSLNSLLAAIKAGRMAVTDGPLLDLRLRDERSQVAHPGQSLTAKEFEVVAECVSCPDFGPLKKITLFWGDLNRREEVVLEDVDLSAGEAFKKTIVRKVGRSHGFVRAELYSARNDFLCKCFTNPIWVETAG